MQDQLFDRRLGKLFASDAMTAVPDGTSVRAEINRRLRPGQAQRRYSLLVVASVAAVALGLLLAVTPARAAVGDILRFAFVQRFGTVLVAPTTAPSPTAGADGKSGAVAASPIPMRRLTLAQAQQLAGFHIPQPSFLPPGVVFRFAFAEQTSGVLSYGRVGDTSSGMFIQIDQGGQSGGYAIPATAAKTVKVHGHDAVYAHGSWDQSGNWRGSADSALLSWQGGGFTYVMSYSGLGLTQADMIRIAESLQ